MNHQALKRWASVLLALLSVFPLPVGRVQAQDKDGTPAKKELKWIKAHDHGHEGQQEEGFRHFLMENRTTIQIVAGAVMVGGIALLVYLRVAKGRPKKDAPPPPAPGSAPDIANENQSQ